MSQNDPNDKLFLILNKISEVSERTVKMEARMDGIEKDISEIKREDEKQNSILMSQNKELTTHIEGTITNRKRLEIEIQNREDLEKRLAKLEETPKFLKNLKIVILYIAAIGGSIMGILSWFSK